MSSIRQRHPTTSAPTVQASLTVTPRDADYNRPILKLGIVSISMAILPIATYFGTLGRVFEEKNTTAAAISAIVVTNLILIGYILLALFEKQPSITPDKSSPNSDDKKK